MSYVYTLKSVNALGDYHETYGATWWGTVNETELPVMFNTKTLSVSADSRIIAEEQEQKQGKKGPFLRLKKVRVEANEIGSQGTGSPSSLATNEAERPPSADLSAVMEELRIIQEKLDQLIGPEIPL